MPRYVFQIFLWYRDVISRQPQLQKRKERLLVNDTYRFYKTKSRQYIKLGKNKTALTFVVVSKSPHYLALLLLLNLKPPELDVEGLTKLLHAKDCVLRVLIIRVWLLKEGHLGAEEGVVGARPLKHHKSLVGLAHLVGSRGFFSKYRDYLVTFKYSMSPPSSWQIKQVMSSALVKCRNTQIPQVVRSSRSHLATAPMAKWSAQMQLFTPTLVLTIGDEK